MEYMIENSSFRLIMSCIYTAIIFFTTNIFYIKNVRKYVALVDTEDESLKEEMALAKTKDLKKFKILILVSILICGAVFAISNIFLKNDITLVQNFKSIVFGFGMSSFLTIAVLDLLYGEIYIYELGITNTLGIILFPMITTLLLGCQCVGKGIALTFGIYFIFKILNYVANKELTIGGADVDTIISVVVANIGLFLAINKRENLPVMYLSYYFETLFTFMIINCFTVIILNYVYSFYKRIKNKDKIKEMEVEDLEKKSDTENETENELEDNSDDKKVKKKKKERTKANFRCLPCFITLYFITLFFLLGY